MNLKLSVFIITLNEERIIEECLKKLHWVDEIVIVDSGSTDKTIEICKKYNTKIFFNKFEGFGKQKQFALNQTQNNWVLSLDADEVLTDSLISEIILSIDKNQQEVNGYFIKRKMVFLDTIFHFGSESNRRILRLFNKKFGKFSIDDVHEEVILTGATKNLRNHFLHYSYASIQDFILKLNSYTQLGAKQKFNKRKKYNFLLIIVKTKFEFFKKYFIELNFLNGSGGFYWSLLSSFSTFIKCMKTNEFYK